MKREHAKYLIATLYDAIIALVSGSTDLMSISFASHIFEHFHAPVIEEAIVWLSTDREMADEQIAWWNEEFGEDAVLEATELNLEKQDARIWNSRLRLAFKEVLKLPEKERTAGNVQAAFLRSVEFYNSESSGLYFDTQPLRLEELHATLRTLG